MSSDSLGIIANRGIAGGRSLAGGGGGDEQTFPLQENDSGLTPADSPFVKPLQRDLPNGGLHEDNSSGVPNSGSLWLRVQPPEIDDSGRNCYGCCGNLA